MSYPAMDAGFSVAIVFFQLQQGLGVISRLTGNAKVVPQGNDGISFGRKFFKQTDGPVFQGLVSLVCGVTEQRRNNGVDENDPNGLYSQFL